MRTKRMFLNTIFSLIEEIVAVICAFILPKLILSYYGSKYNGLIISITQFLSCAVILRSGIGGATRAALYKPLEEKNQHEINAVVRATDLFMKKIGLILIVSIVVFSSIYPFFVKDEFGWIFTFSLFLIIGISTFAESFFGITYLIILQADQKLWISSIIKTICTILNVVIASILILNEVGIHAVKLVSAIAFSLYPIILNIYVSKKYKIDKNVEPNNKAISQRWDAFWHQFSLFVNTNTDVMVLTFFTNMYQVSIYSVYSLIINGIKRFVTAFTNGIEGTFGNMIVKSENRKLEDNLSMVETMVYSISTIIYSCAIILILQFVSIYTKGITDTNYLQPLFSYFLLMSQFFYATRLPYQFIIQAAGHFKQTKKYSSNEVIINLALSIFLVQKYGLVGIAIGTLVSSIYKTIVYTNYLSKNILNRNKWICYKKCFISIFEIFTIIIVMKYINLNTSIDYLNWIFNAVICILVSSTIVGVGILIFNKKDFEQFLNKLNVLIKHSEEK